MEIQWRVLDLPLNSLRDSADAQGAFLPTRMICIPKVPAWKGTIGSRFKTGEWLKKQASAPLPGNSVIFQHGWRLGSLSRATGCEPLGLDSTYRGN